MFAPYLRASALPAMIAALTVGAPLGAQTTARVTGTVVDAITGEPLPDVVVLVVGTEQVAGTDSAGTYVIDSIPPGLVKLRAQILGFHPITTDFYTVLPDTSVEVNFKLAPLVVEVSGVEVTAEREQREWHHGARVLTKEQLPSRGDILQGLQGLIPSIRSSGRRDDAGLVVRGDGRGVLYVVNGEVITPPLTFYIDAADVDCVEMRRGFRAAQEFRPSINGPTYTGVLLIWTRGSMSPRPPQCTEAFPED